MSSRAVVRTWWADEGWGVLDCPDTPGGCWASYAHVAVPGYRSLEPGQEVELEWEPADQDGYSYRATRVWPVGAEPFEQPPDTSSDGAFTSTLTFVFDDDPTGTVHTLD